VQPPPITAVVGAHMAKAEKREMRTAYPIAFMGRNFQHRKARSRGLIWIDVMVDGYR
jgi:hypothetical protein